MDLYGELKLYESIDLIDRYDEVGLITSYIGLAISEMMIIS